MIALFRRIQEWFLHLFKRESKQETMKRRISLYIADNLVKLDEQSLVLFNYTMEDLSNPTYVKNSYSKQITIKGTPNNNKIFGEFFRLDRTIEYGGAAGVNFNPMQKTPFVIFDELGEILESGYAKLDNVKKVGEDVEYKVSLYGGLGSFLYELAYDSNGQKKTLASLDYLGTDNPDAELDFTINKESVAAAWMGEEERDAKWNIINFAPAYNGIPEGNFASNKALVDPSAIGLPSSQGGYTTKEGYARINLVKNYDEWAVKDLRSYLQRPIFSIKALLDAISNPKNNGGYNVDLSGLEEYPQRAYENLWMTLPMIPSLGTYKKETGSLSLVRDASGYAMPYIGKYHIEGAAPSGAEMATNLNVRMTTFVPSVAVSELYMKHTNGASTAYAVYFLQVFAYDAGGSEIGRSKIKCVAGIDFPTISPRQMADVLKFTAGENDAFEGTYTNSTITRIAGDTYLFNNELGFSIDAVDAAYYQIKVASKTALYYPGSKTWAYNYVEQGVLWTPTTERVFPRDYNSISGITPNSVSYTSGETLRSGASITKKMLLSTEHSPADYLISFCRVFGLHMLYDNTTKTISIVTRNSLYDDETFDLTERVDKGKGIELSPFLFDSKWYDFKAESAGGRFADEYKSIQGNEYGIQRVNTGYEFNSESKNIMDGIVYKNAVTILDKSPYYTSIHEGAAFKPSVFVDLGHTQTLWNATKDETQLSISVIQSTANVEYLNEDGHEGYDVEFGRKLELRNKDNKAISGEGVLVLFEGFSYYPYFNLTDDIPAMTALNEGTPCWLITPGDADGIRIPIYQRYTYAGGGWSIANSLDFGIPAELDIPGITYREGATIYEKFWQNYMRDRYDKDTKVMKCKVDFKGMVVSQELLRKFYYYGGSLWVLNKITNYSLTTYDPVECEFIQVQDKQNYLNGQR